MPSRMAGRCGYFGEHNRSRRRRRRPRHRRSARGTDGARARAAPVPRRGRRAALRGGRNARSVGAGRKARARRRRFTRGGAISDWRRAKGRNVEAAAGNAERLYQAQKSAHATGAAEAGAPDLGLALNDYLLGRLELSEREGLYESTRVSLRRRANDRPVDIFELYWADLSRLGEGGFRALSALYQLFFHLGTLAADVVDQVSLNVGGGAAWRLLQRMHAWLAWLMKGPAALVQLSMLMLVLFGAAALVSPEQQGQVLAALFAAGAIVLTALAALAWLRGASRVARWAKLLVLLAAALACSVVVIVALSDE